MEKIVEIIPKHNTAKFATSVRCEVPGEVELIESREPCVGCRPVGESLRYIPLELSNVGLYHLQRVGCHYGLSRGFKKLYVACFACPKLAQPGIASRPVEKKGPAALRIWR